MTNSIRSTPYSSAELLLLDPEPISSDFHEAEQKNSIPRTKYKPRSNHI